MSSYEITKDALAENMRLFISFVDIVCQSHGVAPEPGSEVKLAVEEACNNIVTHGYRGIETGPLTLTGAYQDDRLVFTISDRGHAFDPSGIEPADTRLEVDERPIGGLGLHLLRQSVDEVRYSTDPDGTNHLTLIKLLSAGASSS